MGGIGHYVPQRSGQRQSVNHSNSLDKVQEIGRNVAKVVVIDPVLDRNKERI